MADGRVWRAALETGWREVGGHWVRPEKHPSADGQLRGVGVACAYKNVGYSFGFDDKTTAQVELSLDQDAAGDRVPHRQDARSHGAKGVGEITTLPTAPAILNAIHDATGVWIEELPATAEKVLRGMKRGRGPRQT